MDDELASAYEDVRAKLAEAVLGVFESSPARAYDIGVVEGVLAALLELGGGLDAEEELAEAAAEAHYIAMRRRRTFGACGCGASRMCRRPGTGYAELRDVLPDGGLIGYLFDDDPEAEREDPFAVALVNHSEAGHWSIPEFEHGPGVPDQTQGAFDFDVAFRWDSDPDQMGKRLDDRILHVLAFYEAPQPAAVVAEDIDRSFSVARVESRLTTLLEEGLVSEARETSGGAGSVSRWSWTGRSTLIPEPALPSPAQGDGASSGYDVPGKMPRHLIERMPDEEAALGLAFAALTGRVSVREEGRELALSLVGEVTGPSTLADVVDIVCVVYDADGDPVARQTKGLFPGEFRGFDTFELKFWDLTEPPARVRLYPARS